MLRKVLYAPKAQPFLVAGSGTLGWDMVAANLVEPGEETLVLNRCARSSPSEVATES
jgi:alanine-glyoxylate transaminase/serine-glyoxylate transaminase/serine-pyruvate transaminase